MTMYVLICLSLSLAGVAGLQFFYLAYLEKMDKELKKRFQSIERQNKYLKQALHDAEAKIAEQSGLIEAAYIHNEDDEAWADVIEER